MLRKLKIFWKNFKKLFKEEERDIRVKVDRNDMYEVWNESIRERLRRREISQMQPEEQALICYAYSHGSVISDSNAMKFIQNNPHFENAFAILRLIGYIEPKDKGYELTSDGFALGNNMLHEPDFWLSDLTGVDEFIEAANRRRKNED